MQGWLSDRGSLTARLVARCGQFRVQRLSQRQAVCLADEYAELGLARRALFLIQPIHKEPGQLVQAYQPLWLVETQ